MAIVIWLPRAFQLDQFVTTDEVAWLPRSANFYYALGQRDFAATQMNEAPGITLLWTETAAYLIHFPQYRGFGQGLLDKYKFYEQILAANGVQPLEILTTSRIIMVLIHTFVLAVTFFIAQRIFGLLPAVVGFLFIAFDPYHNALTRLAHLDGPMSSFLYLSLVAFLAYLLVQRSRGYLLISAAAGGLAVLSKIPAWVAVPTIALFAILDYFVWTKRTPVWGAGFWPDFFKRLIRPLLVWGAVFLVTLFVFYPAMWVQPVTALKALILSPLGFAAELANSPAIQNDISIETAEIAAAFGDNPLNYVLRYPAYYLITSSWVVLLGLLAALLAYLFKKGALAEVRVRRGPRRAAPLCPALHPDHDHPAEIIAEILPAGSHGARSGRRDRLGRRRRLACQRLAGRLQVKHRALLLGVLLGGILAIQAILALRTFPYYFTFYNPWIGGGSIFGSGEGLDRAAEYLNQKPGAAALQAISWYGIGPFSYFFKGTTETIPVGVPPWEAADFQHLGEMDYLVTYQNQWMRLIPGNLFQFLEGMTPEHTVTLNGVDYARVYSVAALRPQLERFIETQFKPAP